MNTSFKIAKKIEDLFLNNEILWATEISKTLNISRTIVHIALKDLLENKKII
jgi:DNA-binding transcriptional regulator GbsR (MarR family)